MREFIEAFFMMMAMLVVGLIVNSIMLIPVVLSIALGDMRWLLLLFVSIPLVFSIVGLLVSKY